MPRSAKPRKKPQPAPPLLPMRPDVAAGAYSYKAWLIHTYMKARAKSEKTGYKLTPQFFQHAIDNGCGQFFGVTIEGPPVRIADDVQNPEFLKVWREQHPDLDHQPAPPAGRA